MVSKDFRLSGSDECHPSGLLSLLVARLCEASELLNALTAVTTVENSERKLVLEKALSLTMLKRTVDVDSTELTERNAGRSHQHGTVLVLAHSWDPSKSFPRLCKTSQSGS